MVVLTARRYPSAVAEELNVLAIPTGPDRRTGAGENAPSNIAVVRRDLYAVTESVAQGELLADEAVRRTWDLSLEMMSCLYAAGAPHPVWRRWSALAAFGMVLSNQYLSSCPYLVLAGEWSCVRALAGHPVEVSDSMELRTTWALATGQRERNFLPDRIDDADAPWMTLLDSIPAGDFGRTEASLRELAEFWILEDEEWEVFEARSYPVFEPEVCAVAAVARHRGYRTEHLPDDVMRFLEPGLAPVEPPELYAGLIPETLVAAGA